MAGKRAHLGEGQHRVLGGGLDSAPRSAPQGVTRAIGFREQANKPTMMFQEAAKELSFSHA
jgi:hypothetical protein